MAINGCQQEELRMVILISSYKLGEVVHEKAKTIVFSVPKINTLSIYSLSGGNKD